MRLSLIILLARAMLRQSKGFMGLIHSNIVVFAFLTPIHAPLVESALVLLLLVVLSSSPAAHLSRTRITLLGLSLLERIVFYSLSMVTTVSVWLVGGGILLTPSKSPSVIFPITAVALSLIVIACVGAVSTVVAAQLRRLLSFRTLLSEKIVGILTIKELRDLAGSADWYVASCFAVISSLFFLFSHVEYPHARTVSSALVVFLCSTYSQNLFGFDGRRSFLRYDALLLTPRFVLAVKGATLIMFTTVLCLALDPVMAFSGATVTWAVGLFPSVHSFGDLISGKLANGKIFPFGVFQVGLLGSALFCHLLLGEVAVLLSVGIAIVAFYLNTRDVARFELFRN